MPRKPRPHLPRRDLSRDPARQRPALADLPGEGRKSEQCTTPEWTLGKGCSRRYNEVPVTLRPWWVTRQRRVRAILAIKL